MMLCWYNSPNNSIISFAGAEFESAVESPSSKDNMKSKKLGGGGIFAQVSCLWFW